MKARGLKHGAVEDKLVPAGLRKLARLCGAGFFGRVIGFRLEFGWWVFDGIEETLPAAELELPQGRRRRADPRYVSALALRDREHRSARSRRVVTALATATPERVDERGERYAVDVEDHAATLVELESRRDRHHHRVVGDAGAARRPPDLPDRRHQRLGRRRAAPVLRTSRRARRRRTAHFNPIATDLGVDYREPAGTR